MRLNCFFASSVSFNSRERQLFHQSSQHTNEALHFGALVGESESFVRAIKNIPPLAQSDATVLICGETGTGKELFARAIHYHSPRRNKPFIPVNCAALPDHLFENELFGHVKGAFTDANSSEKGLIAEAEGGTLILDEVDTLSPAAQAKLLRFLQNGEYRPLGSSRSVTANVRIIAATNADLFDRVKAKLFREDLYYRLNALSLIIPPLRERIEDIVHLSNHFLTQYARERNTERRSISSDALRKLMAYEWPGNVRELEGVILRALILTTSSTLQPEDINLPQQSPMPAQENTLLRQAKTNMIQNFELSYLTNLLASTTGILPMRQRPQVSSAALCNDSYVSILSIHNLSAFELNVSSLASAFSCRNKDALLHLFCCTSRSPYLDNSQQTAGSLCDIRAAPVNSCRPHFVLNSTLFCANQFGISLALRVRTANVL